MKEFPPAILRIPFSLTCLFGLILIAGTAAAAKPRISVYQATLIRDGDHLTVKEAYSFENPQDTPETLEGGGLSFSLPETVHGDVQVTVNTSGERRVVSLTPDTKDPRRWILPGALAPGRTSVTISYAIHYDGQADFTPRFFYAADELRLYVRPPSLKVEGHSVHPQSESVLAGFSTYALDPLIGPSTITVHLSGGDETAAAAPPSKPAPEQEEWHVEIRPNRFSETQTRIIFFLMLTALLGLGLAYGNSRAGQVTERAHAIEQKRSRLHRLEDRLVTGNISREEFIRQRDVLLSRDVGKGKKKRAAQAKRRA